MSGDPRAEHPAVTAELLHQIALQVAALDAFDTIDEGSHTDAS